MQWRWWLVLGLCAPACAVDGGGEGDYTLPPDCSHFALDAPTNRDTWTTDQATITVSGPGGTPPIRWRNLATGASGDGEVVERLEYDPWFCPEGCPVRRFGAYVPLAVGANSVEITDESCRDTLLVDYVQ
jgi:hypothetical protein